MAWSVSSDPVDFLEAVVWFRKRVRLTREEVNRLSARSAKQAFWVSHVAQLDVVHHVWRALDKAIANGTALDDFKKSVSAALRKAWAGSVEDPAWRMETIFRTNIQNAYSAGRYRQATTPEVLEDRPVWMFDAILDGRETEFCNTCDGIKRPADDPWWKTHYPPGHFNCRSSVITLTEEQAGALSKAPKVTAQSGFGVTPSDDPRKPDLTKYPDELRSVFEDKTK
jgi:SPP1 gp7 family putative phage head morphogenesis protein